MNNPNLETPDDTIEQLAKKQPVFFWMSALVTGAIFAISTLLGAFGIFGYKIMSPFDLQSLSPAETFSTFGTDGAEISVGPYTIPSVLSVSAIGKADPAGGNPHSEQMHEKPHIYVQIKRNEKPCGAKALAYANPNTATDTMVASTVCTFIIEAEAQATFTLSLAGTHNNAKSVTLVVKRRPCVECQVSDG